MGKANKIIHVHHLQVTFYKNFPNSSQFLKEICIIWQITAVYKAVHDTLHNNNTAFHVFMVFLDFIKLLHTLTCN